MNRGKLFGLLVLALLLVIVPGCGRKRPPSLPQKPSASAYTAFKELRNVSHSLDAMIAHNGCYAGFPLASRGNTTRRSSL